MSVLKPYTRDGDIDLHIVHDGGCWEVRRTGQRTPVSRHRTRSSAIKAGRLIADESGTALHVHGHDGSVIAVERVR